MWFVSQIEHLSPVPRSYCKDITLNLITDGFVEIFPICVHVWDFSLYLTTIFSHVYIQRTSPIMYHIYMSLYIIIISFIHCHDLMTRNKYVKVTFFFLLELSLPEETNIPTTYVSHKMNHSYQCCDEFFEHCSIRNYEKGG